MTKKLLSILLAVLMVLTFVTPAMAEDLPAGTAVARLESTGAEYETLQAAIDAAKAAIDDENGDHSAQTVTLLADVTESVTMYWVRTLKCKWNFDLTIDLNGKTVNGGGERAFYFADTSNAAAKQTCTIRIKDSVGTGKVTGGVADNGGAIYLKGKSTTTVIVDGGTFTGNTATSSGGAIWANMPSGGKIVINGGVFTQNTAVTGGSAICAANLTVNGGTFTENSVTGTENSAGCGGAICVWSTTSVFVMTGGKIYNNTASLNGDDIVWASTSTAKASSPKLQLISAKDMGVQASGWFRDEVGNRYSAENAVEFTDYANYKGKGTDKAVSLKAVINPEYTVKYVDGASGEAFETEEYTVKAGEATPAFQGDLTKYPGWKFKAWTPDLADTVTEDVTYTATWEPKGANTIIYWGNGGTRSKYSIGDTFWSEYTSAAEIKVRGNGFLSFALDEYAFNGWNTKADGTGDSYKSGDMYKFTAAHDLDKANLYAQWVHVACDKHLEDIKVITEPTCTEKGLKLCRCTVCGDEYEVEIPALGHDHGGRWTWNREEHWKKCLRCGAIIDCEEHTYGDWKPVVDNKGKDTDREERSCTVCGFTQYAQTIHIGGSTVTKPTDEQNPNTGAQVPSLLPALAVLAGAAVVLRKRK